MQFIKFGKTDLPAEAVMPYDDPGGVPVDARPPQEPVPLPVALPPPAVPKRKPGVLPSKPVASLAAAFGADSPTDYAFPFQCWEESPATSDASFASKGSMISMPLPQNSMAALGTFEVTRVMVFVLRVDVIPASTIGCGVHAALALVSDAFLLACAFCTCVEFGLCFAPVPSSLVRARNHGLPLLAAAAPATAVSILGPLSISGQRIPVEGGGPVVVGSLSIFAALDPYLPATAKVPTHIRMCCVVDATKGFFSR
jgi:hypothetical protein